MTAPAPLFILRYDVYITGLRGANTQAGGIGAGGGGSTDLVNAEGRGDQHVEVERRPRSSPTGITNLGAGTAGGVLERALQQLAALGGENMSDRINVRVKRRGTLWMCGSCVSGCVWIVGRQEREIERGLSIGGTDRDIGFCL